MNTTKSKKRGRKKSVVTKSISSPETSNSTFKVEKGIPVAGVRLHTNLDHLPFHIMNVGDSFLIPKDHKLAKNPNSLHYAAKIYARMKPGFTITTRMQVDKNRRVWRLK